MVITRRKKVTKYRAHTTHGGGHRKKRRGAGSRGGRGNAGTGKRAGQKKAGRKPTLGRNGFLPRRSVVKTNTLNLSYFTSTRVERMVASGKASKEGGMFTIDFSSLGYTKLLGSGNTTLKLNLIVSSYSAKAAEKVQAAGGKIQESGSSPKKALETVEQSAEQSS